jgi:hypothetical protein
MRIFFPAVQLSVALTSFIILTGMLYRSLPRVSAYLLDDSSHGSFNYGNMILWHVIPLLIGMMVSVAVANYSWKEIRSEKMGRLDQ